MQLITQIWIILEAWWPFHCI